MSDSLEQAREWRDQQKYLADSIEKLDAALAALLDAVKREARLEEAKLWKHSLETFVLDDWRASRIAALEPAPEPASTPACGGINHEIGDGCADCRDARIAPKEKG